MDKKNDDEDRNSEDSSKLANEYLQRASYLGTILPLLDIAYVTLVEPVKKKYNLNIVKEFWIFLGLLIFSIIYYFYGVTLEVILFFLFATLFTLIVYNFAFFKKRILPNEDEDIQQFILAIDKKTFPEVIEFIKNYRNKLKDTNIQLIINSNHGNIWSLYQFLFSYQKISSDTLVYILRTKKLEIIGVDQFKKYIKHLKVGMKFDDYKIISEYFKDNRKILKTINTLNPTYVKTESIFKGITISLQSFYLSVWQGRIRGGISFISFLLVAIVAVVGFHQFAAQSAQYMNMEPYHTFPFLFIINFLFAMAIMAALITLFISLCLTTLTRIAWAAAGIFAPDQLQI